MFVNIDLKFSFCLTLFICVVHCAGAGLVLVIPLWIGLKSFLYTLVFLSALVSLLRWVFCAMPSGIQKIIWTEQQGWSLVNRRNETQCASLMKGGVVTRWLAILHFKTEKRRRAMIVIIPADSVDRTSFRRLRVCLLTLTS